MHKIYLFTPEKIEECLDIVSQKYKIEKDEILDIAEKRYKGISNYVRCKIILDSSPSSEIVFFYYSGSRDSDPGKGAGEKIPPFMSETFNELKSYQDWRKILSNFWTCKFRLDGYNWASVEHYYQASKFRSTPEFFNLFSLDSNSQISKDPILAKAAGGKSGKYKGKLIRPANVVIDDDFFNGENMKCNINMYRAIYAKFSQNENLKKVLLATKNATLTHGTRGVPTKPVYTIMKVREDLKNL